MTTRQRIARTYLLILGTVALAGIGVGAVLMLFHHPFILAALLILALITRWALEYI